MTEWSIHLWQNPTEWLRGTGPDVDVVVSSRIRLARNLAGYPFVTKLTKEQEEDIIDMVEESVESEPALKNT